MMAGAEEGRGAILSTRARTTAPAAVRALFERNRKISLAFNSDSAPTSIVTVLAAKAALLLAALNSTSHPDASPQTEQLGQKDPDGTKGKRPGVPHSLLGGKRVVIRLSIATR